MGFAPMSILPFARLAEAYLHQGQLSKPAPSPGAAPAAYLIGPAPMI